MEERKALKAEGAANAKSGKWFLFFEKIPRWVAGEGLSG